MWLVGTHPFFLALLGAPGLALGSGHFRTSVEKCSEKREFILMLKNVCSQYMKNSYFAKTMHGLQNRQASLVPALESFNF